MSSAIASLLFGVLVFAAAIFIVRRFGDDQTSSKRRHKVLNQIYEEQEHFTQQMAKENVSILRAEADATGALLLKMPKGPAAYELLLKAGFGHKVGGFMIGCAILGVVLFWLGSKISFMAALGITAAGLYFLPRKYLRMRIKKRNETFINMFPDAVDMIVRSVKSGHPLNTALRMIAENIDPPVKTEFKQLVDEIAFGRSTTEALVRMSKRVDEPDLQFFVVILSVQQETGGNLAEVLSNLSGIIRKRKQLRLKIKAMTSEGRATGLILGALPLVVMGAIYGTSPEYLEPLFTEPAGKMVLAGAIGLLLLAFFVIKSMLNIDI